MLTHEKIVEAVSLFVDEYDLESVSYFGSYATYSAVEESDLDLLVKFKGSKISLLHIIGLKQDLEDYLGISVDVIKLPLSKMWRSRTWLHT